MLGLIRRLCGFAEKEPTPEELRPRLQEVVRWLQHPLGVKEVLDELTRACPGHRSAVLGCGAPGR